MGTSIYCKYPIGCDFEGQRVLNIGCGFARYDKPNVVNLDAFSNCKPDVVWDLNKTPYPFDAGSFDLIIANHILEHLQNWWGCINECSRLLRSMGRLEIWVPGSGSDSIFGYRDHVAEINHCSFYGAFGTYREAFNAWAVENAGGDATWLKLNARKTVLDPEIKWIHKMPLAIQKWCWRHLRNVALEEGFIFRKVTMGEWENEQDEFRRRIKQRRDSALPLLPMPASSVR